MLEKSRIYLLFTFLLRFRPSHQLGCSSIPTSQSRSSISCMVVSQFAFFQATFFNDGRSRLDCYFFDSTTPMVAQAFDGGQTRYPEGGNKSPRQPFFTRFYTCYVLSTAVMLSAVHLPAECDYPWLPWRWRRRVTVLSGIIHY